MFKKKFIFILTIAVLLLLSACGTKGQQVASVNGEPISLKEAKFYLALVTRDFEAKGGQDIWETPFDGRTAEEVAKERAMESAIKSKLLAQKADDAGIDLSEDQNKQVDEQVEIIVSDLGEAELEALEITRKDVKQYLSNGMKGSVILYSLDIKLDEDTIKEDVNSFIEEYKNNKKQIVGQKFAFPRVDKEGNSLSDKAIEQSKELADEVEIKLKTSTNIKQTIRSLNLKGESFEVTKDYPALFNALDEEVASTVRLDLEDAFNVFYIEEIVYPEEETLQELSTQWEQILRTSKKQEAYESQYEDWKLNAEISLNDQVWNQVEINK